MSYIGSTPTTQSFIAGTDYFNGTGAQVAFTLSRSVNSVNDIEVVVNNVEQSPASYSASGTTLTFSAAPSSGTGNIYVRYLSTALQSIAPSQGSVSPDKLTTGAPYWDASGNVGIGTSTPNGNLNVLDPDGTAIIQLNGQADSIYRAISSNTGKSYFACGDTNDLFIGGLEYQHSVDALIFHANNAERMRLDSAGNLKFNSGYGSVATAYGCRAWVNFNGTGTVAIRASGNVSSITDNGVSDYAVNFATAMVDANYSGIAVGSQPYHNTIISVAPTASIFRFLVANPVAANADQTYVNVAIFR